MRKIDVYYITREKTIKIHGIGIAYNFTSTCLYGKGIAFISSISGVTPILACIGASIGISTLKRML